MSKNILSVENVTMQFGGVVAVDDLALTVNEGEIVALIGPNGAGKTTAFNVITGVYAPTNGRGSGRWIPTPLPTACYRLRRTRSRRWAWPVPFRISGCGKRRPCLTMY